MAGRASVYKEKGVIPTADLGLLKQLNEAVVELEVRMEISKQIYGGLHKIGFGVDKTQRGIAADSVISIAKAIKALKGW